MLDAREIEQSALALMDRHGVSRAEVYAEQRVDALLSAGDADGGMTWLRILATIRKLEPKEQAPLVH